MEIADKRIVVLGAGSSGLAAARLAESRHAGSVTLLDGAPAEKLERQARLCAEEGIQLLSGWRAGSALPEGELVVVSPGIRLDSPMLQPYRERGVRVCSELEFGSSFCPWPLVAITGTNGKTTSVELLTHCLQAAGCKCVAAGNIGLPLSALLLEKQEYELVVLEVSTFQMETTQNLLTEGAALLNLTPDHLDRHGSLQEYFRLKLELLRQVRPGGPVVLNANLCELPQVRESLAGRRCLTFSAHQDADFCVQGEELCQRQEGRYAPLLPLAKLRLRGGHNWENALAVLALGASVGIAPQRLLAGMESFVSGEHRLAVVEEINGVRYINDSKGTNVDAVIKALEFCAAGKSGRRIILLAGGIDKGCLLEEAKMPLKMYVKAVCLFGACRDRLAGSWGEVVPVSVFLSLSEAVKRAQELAVPGDTVLFSPGCSSFDMFRDYMDRGNQFIRLVQALPHQ